MQGYVDLVRRPTWNAKDNTLSGVSRLVAGEPYRVVLAGNGYRAAKAETGAAKAKLQSVAGNSGLVTLELLSQKGGDVAWTVHFAKD